MFFTFSASLHPGNGQFNADGSPEMDTHHIQRGGGELKGLVVNATESGDTCQPDGPIGLYMEGSHVLIVNVQVSTEIPWSVWKFSDLKFAQYGRNPNLIHSLTNTFYVAVHPLSTCN